MVLVRGGRTDEMLVLGEERGFGIGKIGTGPVLATGVFLVFEAPSSLLMGLLWDKGVEDDGKEKDEEEDGEGWWIKFMGRSRLIPTGTFMFIPIGSPMFIPIPIDIPTPIGMFIPMGIPMFIVMGSSWPL